MKMLIPFVAMLLICSSCSDDNQINEEEPMNPNTETPSDNNSGNVAPTGNTFTLESTVNDVISDPAFGDFGRLLFPVDRSVSGSMTLAQVSSSNVYVWYSHIQPQMTVEIINRLHDDAVAGKQIFYPIYSAAEIAADPSKADTGLFFFRGEIGKPFAITNAGGGFMYVGAMHDSFPHSIEISNVGYNAFALIYRPDDPYSDLAKAIEFVHDNAGELGVKVDDYSLWGGSAGARMAAILGNKAYLQQLTGRTDIPQASAVIMQYTGYNQVSQYDAPTCVCRLRLIRKRARCDTELFQLTHIEIAVIGRAGVAVSRMLRPRRGMLPCRLLCLRLLPAVCTLCMLVSSLCRPT